MYRLYSARQTRWLDRLAHFDFAIHDFAGSNLNFTDFLSRNPVEKGTSKDVYDEQYKITINSEQAELNVKYRPLFVDQPQNAPERIKITEGNLNNQSHRNRTFEKNRDVNKNYEKAKSASNKSRRKAEMESSIRNLNINSVSNSNKPKEFPLFRSERDRDYFQWRATAEIMEILWRRRKST